jgi:hypothetical protein
MSNVVFFPERAVHAQLRRLVSAVRHWRTVRIAAGRGTRCSLCQTPLYSHELEYEVVPASAAQFASDARPALLRFHGECRAVWERASRG